VHPHESRNSSNTWSLSGKEHGQILQVCNIALVFLYLYSFWVLILLVCFRSFRALFRVVQSKYTDVKAICDDNKYSVEFLEHQANLLLGWNKNCCRKAYKRSVMGSLRTLVCQEKFCRFCAEAGSSQFSSELSTAILLIGPSRWIVGYCIILPDTTQVNRFLLCLDCVALKTESMAKNSNWVTAELHRWTKRAIALHHGGSGAPMGTVAIDYRPCSMGIVAMCHLRSNGTAAIVKARPPRHRHWVLSLHQNPAWIFSFDWMLIG
jgi:hypothetical protein